MDWLICSEEVEEEEADEVKSIDERGIKTHILITVWSSGHHIRQRTCQSTGTIYDDGSMRQLKMTNRTNLKRLATSSIECNIG